LLGHWKDYQELEENLSMPELVAILSAKQEEDFENKKFLAALQGVDNEGGSQEEGKMKWEEIKARAYSKGNAIDSNDVVGLQGAAATQAGFGIGLGLDYEVIE
jgi:hypothetical protein